MATGSVEPSSAVCWCCGRERGYVYVGPVYTQSDVAEESLCPWCIADGSAHERSGAEFTDSAGIGGYVHDILLPQSVVEDVAYRTPGFSGWQQERWLACCGDAAAFVGRAGWKELSNRWPDAIGSIQQNCGMADGDDWQSFSRNLDREGSPTAYIFQCLHCGRHLGYTDCD
jgi:uncharacterized protein CbrC (UPF0167 family)